MTEPRALYNALDAATAGMGIDMYQKRLARVDVYEESLLLTRYTVEGRPATCFEVDPRDLAAAFAGQPLQTGLLPPGCLWYGRVGGYETVGVYIAPQMHTLRCADGATYNVPLPGLVFSGSGTVYYVWAVKAYPTQESERLFHAPLPNVYTDGKICPGNVAFPVCSLQTIRRAVAAFLESEFNNHLVNEKSRLHKNDVREMWAELAVVYDSYPLEDLMMTPYKLGQAMQGKVA